MQLKSRGRGDRSVSTTAGTLLLAALILVSSASGGERFPGVTWEQFVSVEEAGFSSSKLDEAKKYWESIPSAAVVVVCDGAIVVAWGDIERRFMLHSARKSVMSALYGVYAGTGQLDTKKTLEQLGIDDEHPRLSAEEKQARIVDLLSARSGVYHAAAAEPPGNPKPKRGSYAPGTHWCYNNWDFNALGTIFRQEFGVDIFEEFKKRFADPLEMQDYRLRDGYYELDPRKSVHPSYPVRMSARDMARFGLLYLKKGRWRDTQIIPEAWIAESTHPHSYDPRGDGYGYMWWVPQQEPFKSLGMFSARGVGEQSIDVIPGAGLVIVHRCNTYDRKNVTRVQRLKLLEKILAAKVSDPKPDARLVPLQPAAKSNKTIKLSDKEKKDLCGRVPLEPFGDTVTVRLDDGDVVFEGPLGTFALLPVGKDRFVVEDVNWQCRAERDTAGALVRLVMQP